MIFIIINAIQALFMVLSLAIVARALISWFPISPYHPAVTLLRDITEPFIAPVRRFLPATSGLDLAPLATLILLQVIERVLIGLLAGSF